MPSGFHIYNASAGSGKTYQLTRSYLKLVLSNIAAQRFREILALTFTNKAVEEMKTRILDSLYRFGNPEINKDDNPMFLELAIELGLSSTEMEKRSSNALKLLLHNYDFFEVSTIDKFTHRVIKAFAKDLKVSQHFEVELDTELLLDGAIAQLLQRVGDEPQLQKILIAFSLEKVESDKSWTIIKDLKNIGGLLFKENHYVHLKALVGKEIGDFEEPKTFFSTKIASLSSHITEYAAKALKMIQDNGLEFSDFKGGYFPKFMRALQSGNHKVDFKAAWKQHFDETPLYTKSCPEHTKIKLDELHPHFSSLFKSIKENVHALAFFKNVYTNILPLTVLNEIAKEVSALQKEREILHISEFNKLISNEITNQPVPYIYERLGEKYRHYFIDEFQDTSKMQWENLVPLIGNALETENLNGEKGSLLLVGDAKQSIYRWRGGNPKQFLGLSDKSQNPFTIAPEVHNLDTNWRSYDSVVEFNNAFFGHIAPYFKEIGYQKLYSEQCQQQTNHKKGGYIEIGFAPSTVEDSTIFYCENVLKTIQRILNKGFHLNDICILVRKNHHGILLANYLTEHGIPIISSEALLLANNPEVQFLVSLLRFLDNPLEKALQFDVLEYLFKTNKERHHFIIEHLGSLPAYLKKQYAYDISIESGRPVLDILERAIASFHLSEKCGAHVVHFLDTVLEIAEKTGVGIYEFLEYWNLKKEVLAISAPQDRNAVRLMTIHKSKGLEFQFVIFPFADSRIKDRLNSKKIWVPLSASDSTGIQEVLVNVSPELEHYSDVSRELYTSENHLSELDDINVLYVALTRAIEGLFILTKESRTETYGKMFKNYLLQKGIWDSNTTRYQFGKFMETMDNPPIKTTTKQIPYTYNTADNLPKIATASQSLWEPEKNKSLEWGNILHSILAEINTLQDVDGAVLRALTIGDVSQYDAEPIRDTILKILTHPQLSEFFQEKSMGRNEVEILDGHGRLYRPDRLVFHGKQVAIIDYKTGAFNSKHHQQLESYATVLEELDLVVTQKILVYIGEQIEPVFI
ncbi:UvrD-helicase domain-containing protein [Flavobacteriaceae bacterium GF1]